MSGMSYDTVREIGTLQERIRDAAYHKRVSQERLAQAIGISRQGIVRRLSGQTPFSIDELVIIAKMLDTTVGALIGEA
jgi:transcriptional regulator with XRE-family HTH domain